MPNKVEQPVPEVITMLLAEVVYQDPDTAKFCLLGVHKLIGASAFPTVRPKVYVFVELSDGRGDTALELRLVDADEEREPVFSLEGRVDFADNPNQTLEGVFEAEDVTFPEAGEYRLQLFAAGQFLQERRIQVLPYGKNPDADE